MPPVTSESEAASGGGSDRGSAGSDALWTVQDMHSHSNGMIPRSGAMQSVPIEGLVPGMRLRVAPLCLQQ